jgi:hypothetical protein
MQEMKRNTKGPLAAIGKFNGDTKFETWLGNIIKPTELFYLTAESKDQILVEGAALNHLLNMTWMVSSAV